jgi:hypothetical protein
VFTAKIYTTTTSVTIDIDYANDWDDAYSIARGYKDLLNIGGDLLSISILPQD